MLSTERTPHLLIVTLFLALSVRLLQSCNESGTDAAFLSEIEVSESTITDNEGSTLIEIGDIPGDIRPDGESSFGAAERFTDAKPSPCGKWLAVSTSGVSHGAGWIVSSENGSSAKSAAFQYGGSVSVGEWQSYSQYALFFRDTPAGTTAMTVTEIPADGETVEENSRSVSLPEENGELTPDMDVRIERWDGESLVFTVNGEEIRYTPGDEF